jgi:predicted ATPase
MRPELPSGRVTLLFTDVEGSTKLLHSLGAEAYAEALAEHRRVIRDACAAEGGVEVDTQGDAFFFAFATAPGALQAASAFTDGLASGPIQVRVGLHTGTPLVTDEGYVGDDVHLAARVAATSHGGQVVLSEATAELVEAFCTDLGEHRLKDIAAPVSIFQLGDASFPPLKTISNTNLPRPASSFLGREAELHDVLSRIGAGARLVALTGPGGTGKTRLAIEAASTLVGHYTAGVFWIGLAPVRDPALVIETIAHVLGAKDGLAAHIGERDMLLLLDNLEHLIEAATGLSELLQSCPNLTLLVTSRELVRIQGEVEYPVPPLATEEAVDLFCARSGLPPTDEIAELCSRLDSLPLSVELAAARTKALTVSQILERLSGRLDLLRGGRDADPRQQTLRATIEWSYDLLQPAEQALFARLSVFAGGCTLDAAEEVADADLDTLQSLVEKSLLRFSSERYWMLQTIRELAEEKLAASGSADERRRRHAKYYLGVGRSLGLTMENLERTGAQRHDLAILEQNNFRAAIDWAFGADLSLAVEIAFALENFWVTHDPQEGIRRFDAFLARSDDLPVALRAAAHRCRGNVTIFAGDRLGGVEHYEAARAAYREAGDEIGTLLMEHRQLSTVRLATSTSDGKVSRRCWLVPEHWACRAPRCRRSARLRASCNDRVTSMAPPSSCAQQPRRRSRSDSRGPSEALVSRSRERFSTRASSPTRARRGCVRSSLRGRPAIVSPKRGRSRSSRCSPRALAITSAPACCGVLSRRRPRGSHSASGSRIVPRPRRGSRSMIATSGGDGSEVGG